MKCLFHFAIAVLTGMLVATTGQADVTLTGVYDPAGDANDVDQSGTFGSGTASSTSVVNLATFRPLVEGAFAAGTGGIISFDQTGDALDSPDPNNTLTTSGGLANDATFTFNGPGDGGTVLFGGGTVGSGNRIPTSGSTVNADGSITGGFRLGLTGGNGTFEFNDFSLSGTPTDTGVTAFGATLVHRQTDATFTGAASFSDGTNLTFAPLVFTAGDSANTLDTFFGVVAPTGETITSLSIARVGGSNTWIDDIGFVTSTVTSVPEPSSLSVMMLVTGLAAIRRRRK